MTTVDIDLGKYALGWADTEDYVFKPKKGLNEEIIREMSAMKGEPDWMLDFRLKALEVYESKPMPTWGGDLEGLEQVLDEIDGIEQPADLMVDVGDLPVVGGGPELLGEGGGRLVVGVGIVVVNEEEESFFPVVIEPGESILRDPLSCPYRIRRR